MSQIYNENNCHSHSNHRKHCITNIDRKQHSYSHSSNQLTLHFTTHLFLFIHQTQSLLQQKLWCTRTRDSLHQFLSTTSNLLYQLSLDSCEKSFTPLTFFANHSLSYSAAINLYPKQTFFLQVFILRSALQCLHTSHFSLQPTAFDQHFSLVIFKSITAKTVLHLP